MTKTFREALEAMEPVGYMHMMDNTDGIPSNEPMVSFDECDVNPYGTAGVDFSESFPVTTEPLYTADQAASAHAESVRELVEAVRALLDMDVTYQRGPRVIVAEMAVRTALQRHESGAGGEQPCPDSAHMGEHACKNKAQCWEPCGELGKDARFVKVAEQPAQAVEAEVVSFLKLVIKNGGYSGASLNQERAIRDFVKRASSANAPADSATGDRK